MESILGNPDSKRATLFTYVFRNTKINIESLKGCDLRGSEFLRQDVAKEK